MQSVQHVATKHRSLAQDHYQKLLPHLCWLFRSTGGFQNMEELPYMCCSLLANDHVFYLFFLNHDIAAGSFQWRMSGGTIERNQRGELRGRGLFFNLCLIHWQHCHGWQVLGAFNEGVNLETKSKYSYRSDCNGHWDLSQMKKYNSLTLRGPRTPVTYIF